MIIDDLPFNAKKFLRAAAREVFKFFLNVIKGASSLLRMVGGEHWWKT
jgi:hypothetical protein